VEQETLQLAQRYELQSVVGRGGMGEVWRAIDLQSRQTVAIKRLLLSAGGADDRARLLREADTLRELSHPHIVRYLDAGFDAADQPFLVLEWLEGEDLAARQRREPLTLEALIALVGQLLEGLEACHAQGVTHRDIKPSNIFITQDEKGETQIKLVDFGLARLSAAQTRLTRTGMVLGTLHYLAPEQVRGSVSVDHRADLYAVGVLLYELTTGELPFFAEEAMAVMLKIISETPRWPTDIRPDLPLWVEECTLRAMRRSPSDRFQSATEMLAALSSETCTPDVFAPTTAKTLPLSSVEQRLVSLLCVDGVDVCRDLLSAEHVAKEIDKVGGVSQALLGGRMVGLFGLQQTRGDEPRQAISAGLAIRELAVATEGEVQLLVATVHVEIGQRFELDRRELDDATRAMAELPPGELIVDNVTRQLLGDQVQFRRGAAHHVVLGLARQRSGRRHVLGVETPTVGRESELAGLKATYTRVADTSESEATLIIGSAGAGKTRVLQELTHNLRESGAFIFEATPDSSRVHVPYGLFTDAFSRLLDDGDGVPQQALQRFVERALPAGEEAAVVFAFIAEAMGFDGGALPLLRAARADAKLMRQQVHDAFAVLFLALTSNTPLCFATDDLQWGDAESLRLLEELLERLLAAPFFVVASARPELLERHPRLFEGVDAEHLLLQPLRRRSMQRLLHAILGRRAPDDLEALVIDRCGGNPYFAEELLSWMVVNDVLVAGEGGWQLKGDASALQLPAGVEGAIQGQLDRLPTDVKAFVKDASVFGNVIWQEGCTVLVQTASLESAVMDVAAQLETLQGLKYLESRKVARLHGTHEWSFCHSLVRQVAYQMLPESRRRQLHLRAGQWLTEAGEQDALVLARHFERGGDAGRAGDLKAQAGHQALAAGDMERALGCFSASLTTPSLSIAERVERTLGVARCHYRFGQYDEAWQTIEQLGSDVGQGGHLLHVDCLLAKGKVLFARNRYKEAEALLVAAKEALREDARDLETKRWFEIQHTFFWVLWAQARHGDGGVVARELYQWAKRHELQEQLCDAKLALAYYHSAEGDLAQRVALTGEAVAHARASAQPYREVDALLLLASSHELVGAYDTAHATLEQADALARRLKSKHHLASIAAWRGRVLCLGGADEVNVEQALVHLQEAIERAGPLGDDRTLAIALVGKARALQRRGQASDLLDAAAAARQALGLVANRVPEVEAEAQLALARNALAGGEADVAVAHALAAVALLDGMDAPEDATEILWVGYEALVAARRQTEASQTLQRARQELSERAKRISVASIRRSFLENVAHNVAIGRVGDESSS